MHRTPTTGIKPLCAAALIFALLTACFMPAAAVRAEVEIGAEFDTESNEWPNWPEGPSLWGNTACLMDAETGSVLYAKGAWAERYPASITKVMTAIIVLDNCALDEVVTMTETGLADAYAESSNCNPVLGEQFTVEQCLQMLLIKSANDIASQLAEYTAGSVAGFAELMNEKAAQLGCLNTHFTNASGLEDDNHYTSAYDMCLIMREAIQYDKILEIMQLPAVVIPETEFSGERYYETHVYLRQEGNPYYYDGCLGGKTGYTDISRSTLVSAAHRNGFTLVGVVMDAPDTGTNAEDMVSLFNYGYTYFNEVDRSRGQEMFMEEATPEPTPAASPEISVSPSVTEEAGVTESETKITSVPETPAAITTSQPKEEIPAATSTEQAENRTRSLFSIILICVLVAAIVILVILQIRANRIRKQNRRR